MPARLRSTPARTVNGMPVCRVRIPFNDQPSMTARVRPLDFRKNGTSQMKDVTNRCLTLKLASPLSLFQFQGLEAWFAKPLFPRSEERRVGKEGRSRWSPYH